MGIKSLMGPTRRNKITFPLQPPPKRSWCWRLSSFARLCGRRGREPIGANSSHAGFKKRRVSASAVMGLAAADQGCGRGAGSRRPHRRPTTARRGGQAGRQESSLRWAGKKFEETPIAHIKASYNNTQIQVLSATHEPLARASCGTEGFRNAKKGTGIAAQTAGIAAAVKAAGKGVTHVRVVVKGLGPGRLSAIKGLTMGGLEVISVTDNTPIPHNGCRPRKARRL
ncbi:hypothetical protein MC885_004124 [Smutsia gigantea]|nr:hypothetical protein MC885_004124 [Smutsia gigantea]